MYTIQLNPQKTTGSIKPLHGVGGGPVTNYFENDATDWFREAGIPYGRTHDIEFPYGSGEYCDIHCIFPDFDKDVNDPFSYNFALTDAYLQAMVQAGTKPFYRLGNSIEPQKIKRHVFPPKDNRKWGEICSHIISHYNDGWADGFHMGIEYWEIWNEPDCADNWQGTVEAYLALYDTASRIIKRDHPDVKVGGCAAAAPSQDICERFLQYVKENHCPFDFFTWHGYSYMPEGPMWFADCSAALLDKYGFTEAENIYDEWNYIHDWENMQPSYELRKSAFGAAYAASVLSALQHKRVDKAMYYDAQVNGRQWNGLFSPAPLQKDDEKRKVLCEKPYYAFKAWNMLYQLGTEVDCMVEAPLYAAAATDGKQIAVLVSYFENAEPKNPKPMPTAEIAFDIAGGCTQRKAYIIDDTHSLEEVPFDGHVLRMACRTAAVVVFTK